MKINTISKIALLLMIIVFNSCSKKDADILTCELGLEGSNCTIETRAKFLGNFSVVDNITKIQNNVEDDFILNYEVSIEANTSGILKIQIKNFFDLISLGANNSDVIVAKIDDNTITIDSQSVFGITFQGTGSILNGIITINWTGEESSILSYRGTSVYTRK